METVIIDALCSALLTAGRISRHQHAFIFTKHSTVTNPLEATYDWTISLNANNPVDAIYINFQKAFDSVVHTMSLNKLSDTGIPPLEISMDCCFPCKPLSTSIH